MFTQGGKGGVGKSAFATMLVEWYRKQGAPIALIDMDSENKAAAHSPISSQRRGKRTSKQSAAWMD